MSAAKKRAAYMAMRAKALREQVYLDQWHAGLMEHCEAAGEETVNNLVERLLATWEQRRPEAAMRYLMGELSTAELRLSVEALVWGLQSCIDNVDMAPAGGPPGPETPAAGLASKGVLHGADVWVGRRGLSGLERRRERIWLRRVEVALWVVTGAAGMSLIFWCCGA